MNIEVRKNAIIQKILSINNEHLLTSLEAKIAQLFPIKENTPKSKLEASIVQIKESVSLDSIVASQKITSIDYAQILYMNNEIEYKYSLMEELNAL